MKASEFFKTQINDNNLTGLKLDVIDTEKYSEAFNCYIGRESENSNFKRKDGILNFIFDVHEKLGKLPLSEQLINIITFDSEFESNTGQSFFSLSGRNFEDIRIYSNNIVGSVIYNGYNFNINCRFGNSFLQYMIANTSGFIELENFGTIDTSIGLGEWILIYYWKLNLKKAFALGLYKSYKKNQDFLSAIKGEIDINAYIKQPFHNRVLCHFYEHSYNNEINAVIYMALKKVFKSKYSILVSDLYNIKSAFDILNLNRVPISNIKLQSTRNPFFKQYELVFELSLKILQDKFANVGTQVSDFSAFLFDISLMFEHHIRKLLKQFFYLEIKNNQEFTLPNGLFESNLFPDVIIDLGDGRLALYDVKYKNFRFNGENLGVERCDRFQIATYVATYMNKYKIVETGIIYPIKSLDYYLIDQNLKQQTMKIAGKEIPFKVKFYEVTEDFKMQQLADLRFISSFKNLSLK